MPVFVIQLCYRVYYVHGRGACLISIYFQRTIFTLDVNSVTLLCQCSMELKANCPYLYSVQKGCYFVWVPTPVCNYHNVSTNGRSNSNKVLRSIE